MGKRLVSGFLAVTLLAMLALPAMAEEGFTLRNGVQFGDTREQVKAKETLEWNPGDCHDQMLGTKDGTVAGINGVSIVYYFDDDGKLEDVVWSLPRRTSANSSDSDYSKIYKALAEKYGSPLGYTNDACYIITGNALENAVTMYMLLDLCGAYGDMRDYDEWDYTFGKDSHVKIEIAQYVAGSSILEAEYSINVGYKYFTDADLQAAQDAKREKNQAVMNDI